MNKSNFLLGAMYFLTIIALAIFSHFIPLNEEELTHFNCLNFSEVWQVIQFSYLHMNPRLGELLAYFFGHQASTWCLFINTILTFTCILFTYRVGVGKWPEASLRSVATFLFCIITIFGFRTGIAWFLGNMNWLYPCTLALVLFYLTESFFQGNFKLSWSRTLLAIPLAFITGMCNNNTPIVVWILIAGCGAYWFIIKKERITWSYAAILFTLTAASLLFYTAPGTYERAHVSNWELSFSNLLWNSILYPGNWIFFVIVFWRLFLSASVLIILQKVTRFHFVRPRIILFMLAFMLLWGVLIAAPTWGAPRSYLPLEMALACISVHLYFNYAQKATLKKAFLILLLHGVIMSTIIVPTMSRIATSHREWTRIEAMAENAKAKGQDYLIVKSSDLDFSSGLPRIWKLPSSVFDYKIGPIISLIGTTEDKTKTLHHPHKLIESTWTMNSGDHIMNPIAAKKLGLKAVFYLPGK